MEREIEVKVLNIDLHAMEEKIIDCGGEKISDEKQKTVVIDSASHPIPEGLGYLRLREVQCDGKVERVCTFKEKKADTSVRVYDEHTVAIDDMDEMLRIFKLLGYDRISLGEKHRISYRFKNCRLDLDRWDQDTYPDPYMEIEGESREAIEEVIRALSIDPQQVSTLSIRELQNLKNK